MARRKGKHYIAVRGKARYVIKALNKEDAQQKAEDRLQREIERGRKSFPEDLIERWVGMAGLDVEELPADAERPKEEPLYLAWKNEPRAVWRTGGDTRVRKHTTRLDDFEEDLGG